MYELEDSYWWFVARRNLAVEFVAKHSCDGGTILDVGCGTGAGMRAFLPYGHCIGIDFSYEALEFSRSRGIRNLICADAQALPIQSGCISTLVSLDTLEHVSDDALAMQEMARVLKPGGTVILNIPAYMWLWGPHDVALMHQRRYHRGQIRRLLEKAGLEPVRLSYHIFFLFPFVCLSRLLSRASRGRPAAHMPSVPKVLDAVLLGIQKLEAAFLRKIDLPWGSSIVVVAKKPYER
jgi:SAM-dependent methyltransferase